jgi:hypothetical protein
VLPVTTFYARDVAAEMAGKGATDVAIWTGNGTRKHPAVEIERARPAGEG